MYEVKDRRECEPKLDVNALAQKLEKVDLLTQQVGELIKLNTQTFNAQS